MPAIFPAVTDRVAKAVPWRWNVRSRTLSVTLPEPYRVLSWAPFGGGLQRARVIGNHQVLEKDRTATESPAAYLSRIIRAMKCEPMDAIMMMTGVDVRRVRTARAVHGPMMVQAWCTAGCSNALRVGDPSTVESRPLGTINLIVAVSEALSIAALAETLQLATEARVAAIYSAGIRSVLSGEIATGTGTDCVAVAAPASHRSFRYCGKHTRLGELIGRVVLDSCTAALDEAARPL